jgi:hypothetical protein
VTILDEMPLTPVCKAFEPALRIIATQDAVRDALGGARSHPENFSIPCNEDRFDI